MERDLKRIAQLKREFENKTIPEIIGRTKEEFGDKLAMTTAFGYSGIVLMSFVKDVIPDLPIYFIDTRLHFEETLKLARKIKKEWKLNIIHISTKYTEKELEELIGKETYKTNPDLDTPLTKNRLSSLSTRPTGRAKTRFIAHSKLRSDWPMRSQRRRRSQRSHQLWISSPHPWRRRPHVAPRRRLSLRLRLLPPPPPPLPLGVSDADTYIFKFLLSEPFEIP